jgi:hypothetical protein
METKTNIVKEILARAAEEIQTELGLEKDIQTDIMIASLKEAHAAESQGLKEKIGALELEWNLSIAKYDGLLKEYAKLEAAYNQMATAAVQTEQTFKDTLVFYQQSLSNANNINMQACTQLSAYKQKVELLEGKIAQAVALSQAQQQNMSRILPPPQTQAIAQAQAQAELMKRVGAMLQAYGKGTGGVSEQGVPNQKPSLNPTAPEYQPK